MKKKLLFFTLLCVQSYLFSQEDAWVYLTDKQNVTASIANPITILTQDAIDRKALHNISIDARDVSVNENYITQLKAQTGITVLAKSKWFNAVHVRGSQTNINALLNLTYVSSITYADKNLNARTAQNQNNVKHLETADVLTTFNYGDALNQIQMFNGDNLHINDYTGTGIKVAIMDSGFTNVHTIAGFQRVRDAGNILDDYDFVNRDSDVYTNTTSSHGTLVFSDMAGYIQDNFVGTAPDAQYYLFITEDATSENPVEESYWVEAAERADSLGVHVINTSLGYKTYDNSSYSHSNTDLDGFTTYISKGANIAFEKGLLLVNSAGNSGTSGVNAPADSPNVFSIGAVKSDGTYANFSSQGSAIQPTQKPDVVAQGQASYVINENGAISTASGTSFSSPILAGGIVCLWQAFPNLNNAQIMQLVRESASQYTTPNNLLGHGIPNLALAYTLGQNLTMQEYTNIKVYPNPVDNILIIQFPSENIKANVLLYDSLGKKVLQTTITQYKNKLNVSNLSKGIYFLKVNTATQNKALKIVVD